MTDRQELIRNAVAFLTDPKTQASPLAQRVQFLEAKGLTGPEIEQAMRQANSSGSHPSPLQPSFGPVYGPLPYIPQQQPPWDWRDYFITAVISGSLAYGTIALARKYLFPHLQPPSSTAYQEDRDALTAQFDAAEAILKEISAETSAIKAAIESQQEKVDKATADVEAAVQQMREGESGARDEMREIREEVNNIREMIPKMIEKNKEAQTQSLGELQQDLKSLKTLLLSRTPSTSTPAPPLPIIPPRPSIPSWQLSGSSSNPVNPSSSLAPLSVNGFAQPRISQGTPRSTSLERGRPSSPAAKPLTERPFKPRLEDRLRASFTIGDASNSSTPTASSRVSPVPQLVTEHPLSPDIDHPLSPTSIPLPSSPPPNDHAHCHDPLPLDASLSLPDPLSTILPDASNKSVPVDPGSSVIIGPELVDQHSPQKSPVADTPMLPQVSEQKPAASEEGTEVYDTTHPTIIPGSSHDSTISNAESVVGTPQTDRHESDVDSIPVEESQSEHSSSTNVEALQERLKVMEQRFADVSTSFARLQAEKSAADKVVQELTSAQSSQDADGLRDYLQNAHLKVEMSQDEIKRLTGKLARQNDRIEELRETHRLESRSQIELVDELRSQLQQSETLLKATRSSNSQLEADVSKQKNETYQLRAEAERLSGLAKDEEEKRSKAISLLKTVRQKLVKAEKDREDALKDAASLRDSQRIERDREQIDREKLQGELNKLKVEKEVSLADLRAQFEKDLMASKQRSEREISALRSQFELETIAAKSSQEQVIGLKDAQIGRLERSVQSLSAEKDSLFDQLQIRQAEGESAQSLLEVLQGQNTELQYQVREKDDRITLLNEELGDARQDQHVGVSDPSTSPEEVAKLLAAAESRHEAKLAVLRQELAAMEAERVEVETEWRRKVEAKVQEAQKWKAMVDTTSQSRQDDDDRTQELQVEVERLQLAARAHNHEVSQLRRQIERLTHDEETTRQQISDQVKRISDLDQQLEEMRVKELQARTHNKTLREELRKVQSSAALLDRQRGPGVGYWSSPNTSDVNLSPTSAPSQPASTSRPDSPVTASSDEDVNLEYLRNVILQFLEHKEMRPNLIRVLSTILRFTPQETRRLIAKV
ncbi:hypothetical protein BJV78DRAFT_1349405 [Lactifluus subvellereus]|nr:hypothetical protein BJV78DRAFT_1349405 [Lactifluus subvellereus]